MLFRCRFLLPKESKWFEVDDESPAQAANTCHFDRFELGIGFTEHLPNEGRQHISFARIEVEDHGSWVSRVYKHGIWRKGGVQRPGQLTLVDIARILEYDDDPQTLVAPGWEFEETMEEASARKWGKDDRPGNPRGTQGTA